jgi:hypothetical protein
MFTFISIHLQNLGGVLLDITEKKHSETLIVKLHRNSVCAFRGSCPKTDGEGRRVAIANNY